MPAILAVLMFTLLTSCDILQPTPPPPASVDEVVMTRSIDQNTKQPTDPTTTFKSGDTEMHAVAKVSNLVDGSRLEARWYFNSVEIPEVRDSTVISGSRTSGYVSYSLSPSADGFWIGDWKVEVYLDNKLVKSVPFQVSK
jgi:hypothetical protein